MNHTELKQSAVRLAVYDIAKEERRRNVQRPRPIPRLARRDEETRRLLRAISVQGMIARCAYSKRLKWRRPI
ncbi:hypothetical protein Dxin01_02876 [Deinococcus xinjiangensis]|uniref:Uncharacterized protein n=1 Tax=Deinococcus xinjiangensis TaxID=457454 RepID=A0ABP9VD15_9DEIO